MRIAIVPGFVITFIDLFLISSSYQDKFYFWKTGHQALFIFVYFLGYVFMSVPAASIEEVLKKTGLYYLVSGTLLLLLGQALVPLEKLLPTSSILKRIFLVALTGFGKWMFMVGSYGVMVKICAKDITIIGIGILRQISMPFYLLHIAVLWGIRAIALALIHRLGNSELIVYVKDPSNFNILLFVCKLFFGTLFGGIFSYVITKSPCLVKYCFGLTSSGSNHHPKHWLKEYGIFIFLLSIKIFGYAIVKWKII